MIHWINPFLLNSPDNHVHSRKIDPIKVIEQWSLCHHLACVVKYLARAGVERKPLMSLMKAEWYLNRELERIEMGINSCFLCPLRDCSIPLDKILVDWKLVPHLGNAHAYILRARLTARVSIVILPKNTPKQWDLANLLPKGWIEETIKNCLETAGIHSDPFKIQTDLEEGGLSRLFLIALRENIEHLTILERNFKMINLRFLEQNSTQEYKGVAKFIPLFKKTAPTIMAATLVTILMMPSALAQTEGVDAIIKGVSTTILPNLKFGVGVTAGGLGLCLILYGLAKQAVRIGMSGLALGVIPVTLWDSIVGTAATVLIP